MTSVKASPSPVHNGVSEKRWSTKESIARTLKREADRYNEEGKRSLATTTYLKSCVMFLDVAHMCEEYNDRTTALSIYTSTNMFVNSIISQAIHRYRAYGDIFGWIAGLLYLIGATCSFRIFLLKRSTMKLSNRQFIDQLKAQNNTERSTNIDRSITPQADKHVGGNSTSPTSRSAGGGSGTDIPGRNIVNNQKIIAYLGEVDSIYSVFESMDKCKEFLPGDMKPTPLHTDLYRCNVAEVVRYLNECVSKIEDTMDKSL